LERSMNLFQLFFSFRGRVNRGKYWIAVFTYVVAYLIVLGIATGLGLNNPLSIVLLIIAYIPLVISAISVYIRRLHDMDWSGWWVLVLFGLPIALSLLSDAMPNGALFLALANFVISLGTVFILGCPRGTRGPNQYGPDPIPVSV